MYDPIMCVMLNGVMMRVAEFRERGHPTGDHWFILRDDDGKLTSSVGRDVEDVTSLNIMEIICTEK